MRYLIQTDPKTFSGLLPKVYKFFKTFTWFYLTSQKNQSSDQHLLHILHTGQMTVIAAVQCVPSG